MFIILRQYTASQSINQSVKISKAPLNDAQWRRTTTAR